MRVGWALVLTLTVALGPALSSLAEDEADGRKDRAAAREAAASDTKRSEANTGSLPRVDAPSPARQVPGTPPAIYLPPPRSTPQGVRLIGAGTRRGAQLPRQIPLAPDHVGLTEQEQPTLHWYSTGSAEVRVDFVLTNIDSGQTVLDATLADSTNEGFHSISLADHGASLEAGVTYRWYVVLIPDPSNRAADVISAAGVRRVESGETTEDWASLARRSIWYDAIERVSGSDSGNAGLAEARLELLSSVGIQGVGGSAK